MDNREKNKRNIILEQLTYIDDCYDKKIPIPLEEKRKTLQLIGMDSKIREKRSVTFISNLALRHSCYDTLQLTYRTIFKEAALTFNNPTDENIAIIVGQYSITQILEEHLKQEEMLPLEVLIAMSNRTVETIEKSAKVFKKINKVSKL